MCMFCEKLTFISWLLKVGKECSTNLFYRSIICFSGGLRYETFATCSFDWRSIPDEFITYLQKTLMEQT